MALALAASLWAAAPAQAAVIDGGATVNVPGDQASPWVVGDDLTIGKTSAGTLNIQGGGSVSNTHGIIGGLAGSTGSVTVSGAGSRWRSTGELIVGAEGAGALAVREGAAVTSARGQVGSRSLGVAEVGGNSSWAVSGGMTLGTYVNGNGTLNITGGGQVSAQSSTTVLSVGNSARSTGALNIDGPGSAFTVTGAGSSVIARAGAGALNITGGGLLSVESNLFVNLDGNAAGTVHVDGQGSQWNIGGYLVAGYEGDTVMRITRGGAVTNAAGYIGNQASADARVTVDGAGSTWTNNGILYISSVGRGILTVRDGGHVSATPRAWLAAAGGDGALHIGAAPTEAAAAPGTLAAPILRSGTGPSRVVFNHTDDSGHYVFAPAMSSAQDSPDNPLHVDALAGITVMTGASTYYGPATVSGGVLAAVVAHAFSPNADYAVHSAGTLRLGDDQTIASLSNAGAVDLAADAAAKATLTVTGAYAGDGGMLILDTALGDDASPTDKLIAGSTSGATTLRIVNAGGLGAQTTGDGIQVVQVLGESNGEFTLAGTVRAGQFDYALVKGGDGHWYLQSARNGAPPSSDSGGGAVAIPALNETALALLALLLIPGAAALRRYK